MSQHKTVRETLLHVAAYPDPVTDEVLVMHTGELIARTLFDIANKPDASVRGSMSRANKARKIILDRMDGKRRPGTGPQQKQEDVLTMRDLTGVSNGG